MRRELDHTSSRQKITRIMRRYAAGNRLAMGFFKQHHQVAHPRTLSRFLKQAIAAAKAKQSEIFRDGRDA